MKAHIITILTFTIIGLQSCEKPKPINSASESVDIVDDEKQANGTKEPQNAFNRIKSDITSLKYSTNNSVPEYNNTTSWRINANTKTGEHNSHDIQELYYLACEKMKQLYPGRLETYDWKSTNGVPRQMTIVRFGSKEEKTTHLMAYISKGTDYDSFSFSRKIIRIVNPPKSNSSYDLDRIYNSNN